MKQRQVPPRLCWGILAASLFFSPDPHKRGYPLSISSKPSSPKNSSLLEGTSIDFSPQGLAGKGVIEFGDGKLHNVQTLYIEDDIEQRQLTLFRKNTFV